MTVNKTRRTKIANLINDDDNSTQEEAPKRKSGRPRKDANIDSDVNNGDETTNFETATSKRKGRPRKNVSDENVSDTETTNFQSNESESDSESNENGDEVKKQTNGRRARSPKDGRRRRSENRQVLVAADTESGKIKGIFLDAGHAAHVLGMNVKTIKSDIVKGTKQTKLAWLKVPAGETLDQKEIERNAKTEFKEWKATGGVIEKKKPGRKPNKVNVDDISNMIKKTNLNQLDEKTMRKLQSILSKANASTEK
jgi:hypothetical protein